MLKDLYSYLRGRKILILGFGAEGRSSLNFLNEHAEQIQADSVGVADMNPIDDELKYAGAVIEPIIGQDYLDAMADYDIVLKSPGIPFNHFNKHFLDGHWELKEFPNVEVSGQMDLFLRFNEGKVIAVTGSKGKSTTTSLIYEILKKDTDDAYLLGNIGVPVLDHIADITENSYVAVEAGVHQLEFCAASPEIAVVSNIYPEHLDHYQGYEDYYNSKLNLVRFQDVDDVVILAASERELLELALPISKAKKCLVFDEFEEDNYDLLRKFDPETLSTFTLEDDKEFSHEEEQSCIVVGYELEKNPHILGRHNYLDSLLAIAATNMVGVDISDAIMSVANYEGLEHRLEYVGEFSGVKFYNDSIATIPKATRLALEALKEIGETTTILLGGLDRDLDYTELVEYLYDTDIRQVICLPDTGRDIAQLIDGVNQVKNRSILAVEIESMEEAVAEAFRLTKPGEICLLSPAAASYNQYKNFAARGEAYKNAIQAH